MLHLRWLGRVRYRDALALQEALHRRPGTDHLLLLEHEPVYTLGVRADPAHLLRPPADVGAELVTVRRGGDVTFHGPGQLVGYPILDVAGKRGGGMADTAVYVAGVAQLLIDALADLGLPGCTYDPAYPGVWAPPRSDGPVDAVARKLAAIGVRLSRGRSMHGFALNVTDEPLPFFAHIVPCGLTDRTVTSLAREGVEVSMREVVDAVARRAAERWGGADATLDRADVVWRPKADGSDLTPFSRGEGAGTPVRLVGRLAAAGVTDGLAVTERKPAWLRPKVRHVGEVLEVRKLLRGLDLVTVCEEAGCPNLSECWADGTATFMINGEQCTRACGFCLVDTSKPRPLDPDEPRRVGDAVARLGLRFAVVTSVARDDLPDGGAAAFAETIRAVRAAVPGCSVEVLIPDCKGDPEALATIFDARPDVLNHNIETVARLQRAARPSASYARSLGVLGAAKGAGLVTKSSIIVGMGETDDEVVQTLRDLAAIGVDIVTVGQYLRPTSHHLPVARWVEPAAFERFKEAGETMGIAHVEASPLTRSSYHARQASAAAGAAGTAASGALPAGAAAAAVPVAAPGRRSG
ncbi:MAG: lipoyl synthase [Acidimicrobiales bacterium]|nr:lipoyl synthase [Acidimicrobiales bacterium]